MFRVLIVDDEPLARQKLRQLLEAHPEIFVAGEAGGTREALEKIRRESYDAIFLDVCMPEANGFDLLGQLAKPPQVIFVTAHSKYAVEAFAFSAVDYLVKPVRPARLKQAISRLQARPGEGPPWQAGDRVCFRTPGRTIVVRPDAIIALKADGDFTHVYLEGEAPLLICHKLGHYEQVLPSPPFLRLDRSLMIHLDHLQQIEPIDSEHARLQLSGISETFPLGRTARRRLAAVISSRRG